MDIISSLIEVKLDIREKRTEIPLRAWTRCYIKIEAFKSFPCYLKLTFYKNHTQSEPSLELRINIPGLEIYPVKSRTKQYVYGMYWKQNRKQCIAFLSLDSKLSMEAHMKWVECQIENLEQYRKEILQTTRCSRVMDQSTAETEDSGIYQNMNDTNKVRDLNDILGPLPQIPQQESDKSWITRRMSGMSGIYEEIDCSRPAKEVRSSTIYEEMKLSNHNEPASSPPPPLPPRRKRLDTDCSNLQRSYTSPESDLVKKRWNIFDVFHKAKKAETKKRDKVPPQPKELQLLKAKRNSFSSPDLTHLYCPDGSFNNSICGNCSFDHPNISSSNSYELENVCEEDDNIESVEAEEIKQNGVNISQHIKYNFEPNLNNDISTVNLVGCSYTLHDASSAKSSPTMSPPGYLEMRPGRGFDMKKVEELDKQNEILYHLKYSFNSPITYKRENDYDSPPPIAQRQPLKNVEKESHYVPMNVGTKFSPKIPPKAPKHVMGEHTYVPMMPVNRVSTPVSQAPQTNNDNYSSKTLSLLSVVQTPDSVNTFCSGTETTMTTSDCQESCTTKNKRHSIDDKVASYYPNYDVPSRLRSTKHVRSNTAENVVVSRKSKTPEPEGTSVTLKRHEKSLAVPIPLRKAKRFGSFNVKGYSNSLNDDNNNFESKNGSDITKMKYATIARITLPPKEKSNECLVSNSNESLKKTGSISPASIKRITTLAKLKKLDFSPLREKISNALKRHNSGSY